MTTLIGSKPKHVKAYDPNMGVDYFTDGSSLTTAGTRVFLLNYDNSPCFYDPTDGEHEVILEGDSEPTSIHINGDYEIFIP
jgi:hypothetical protein